MRLALTCLFVCLAALPTRAGDDRLLKRFESNYSSAQTLQAAFLERYLDNGEVVRAEAGNAYFLRPGKMRWDYQQPEKNTFLVDGKYVWFYSPGDHTATRMPAKQSEDWRTPLAFLTSHMKLSRLCSEVAAAQDHPPTRLGDSVYRCTLRNADSHSTRSVLFELSPNGELRRFVIPQEGGVTMEFSFTGWRWNPPLGASVFQLTPAPNTVIVDGVLPDTPGMRQ